MRATKGKWKDYDEPSPREKREMMERGEWQEEEEEERRRAPLLFRLLAWASLIVIFFAVGYGATSVLFKWIDDKGDSTTPANYMRDERDAEKLFAARSEDVAVETIAQMYTLSIPEGEGFVSRQIRCEEGVREDMMKQALSAYLDALKERHLLEPSAQGLHIFQSGEWLYLNMNKGFHESLKKQGSKKSVLLLTGLVKTMSENFAPVSKVKFYVDGREVQDKAPVDLTMPWGLRGRAN